MAIRLLGWLRSGSDAGSDSTGNRDSVAARDAGDPPWAARLRRHLALVIVVKLIIVGLLFFLFFSAKHRPDIDPDGVTERLQLDR